MECVQASLATEGGTCFPTHHLLCLGVPVLLKSHQLEIGKSRVSVHLSFPASPSLFSLSLALSPQAGFETLTESEGGSFVPPSPHPCIYPGLLSHFTRQGQQQARGREVPSTSSIEAAGANRGWVHPQGREHFERRRQGEAFLLLLPTFPSQLRLYKEAGPRA